MFTKTTITSFRGDFAKAVKELEEQYGCSIELGNISYDSNSISSKMTATIGDKKIRAKKDDFNVGDIVNINHKKVSSKDQYLITKINNKNIKVQKIDGDGNRVGGGLIVSPGLLVKI
jgi:putative ribosome biogenesis GTPase RsgA